MVSGMTRSLVRSSGASGGASPRQAGCSIKRYMKMLLEATWQHRTALKTPGGLFPGRLTPALPQLPSAALSGKVSCPELHFRPLQEGTVSRIIFLYPKVKLFQKMPDQFDKRQVPGRSRNFIIFLYTKMWLEFWQSQCRCM